MPLPCLRWRIWKTPPQNVPFCVRPCASRALCSTILPLRVSTVVPTGSWAPAASAR